MPLLLWEGYTGAKALPLTRQDENRQCSKHRVDTTTRQAELRNICPRQESLRHRKALVEFALPLGHAVVPELP